MERLKSMKETLISQVQSQLGNLAQVDTKELGEAVDMIKDLEEAIYYGTITKAMGEKEKESHHSERYYTPVTYMRDMDKNDGRMYYNGNGGSTGGSNYAMGGTRYFTEKDYPLEFRDYREGRSPMSRKMYMESKEMHLDKPTQLKELEKYMQELSNDLVEMIQDASPEEKQLLQQKMTVLASKIK
jgi:hypothetical protein